MLRIWVSNPSKETRREKKHHVIRPKKPRMRGTAGGEVSHHGRELTVIYQFDVDKECIDFRRRASGEIALCPMVG